MLIKDAMEMMQRWCKANGTCENCNMMQEHKGCYFREGKTPREWDYDKIHNK